MTGKPTNLAILATGAAVAIAACTLPATAEEAGTGEHDLDTTNTFKGDAVSVSATASF